MFGFFFLNPISIIGGPVLNLLLIADQMGGCLSNAKFFFALIDGVSVSINRQDYSAAAISLPIMVRGGARSGIGNQGMDRVMMKEGLTASSWIPDPVTSYYKLEKEKFIVYLLEPFFFSFLFTSLRM